MTVKRATLEIDAAYLAKVNAALKRKDHKEKNGSNIYSFSEVFSDAEFLADIDVVSCRGETEQDSDIPYVNAVLFIRNDVAINGVASYSEVACCEPAFEKVDGVYHWEHNGDEFVLTVKGV